MKNQPKAEPKRFIKWLICLVTSLTLAPAGFAAQDARARIPQPITIAHHSALGGPNTFVVSGAINDAGSITLDSLIASALPSPVVGTAHYIRTYHGSFGTFTIQLQTLIMSTDVPWLWTETGHWVITEGTGAYEGLQGKGEELGVRDFSANTLDAVFTGKIH